MLDTHGSRAHEVRSHPSPALAGSRRCLCRVDELEAWEIGAALRVVEPETGGRVVVPVETP
jgi:hypothetical protein